MEAGWGDLAYYFRLSFVCVPGMDDVAKAFHALFKENHDRIWRLQDIIMI